MITPQNRIIMNECIFTTVISESMIQNIKLEFYVQKFRAT